MELFVGSRRHDALQKASAWLCAPVSQQMFEDLFNWLNLQSSWGPGTAFVEPDVPKTGNLRTRNVDFIIAFNDRVLVCEVKSSPRLDKAKHDLDDSLRQCAGSFDHVATHLRNSIQGKALGGCVFFPFFNPTEIAELRQRQASLVSYPHLRICGGYRCRADADSYFVDVLQSILRYAPTSDPSRFARDARQVLVRTLDVPSVVRKYSSVSNAVADLRQLCRVSRSVLLNESHIRGLRPEAQRQLHDKLGRYGIVEVIGAAGIGKSEFIKEYLEWFEEQGERELSLATVDCRAGMGTGDLVRAALERCGQDTETLPTDDLALRRLCDLEAVVWITNKRHSGESADAISELLASLPSKASGRRVAFITESVVPIGPVRDAQIQITALSQSQIYQILEARPPGNAEHDRNQIAFWASGNPKLAVARWASRQVDSVPTGSTGSFDWIEYAFDSTERLILSSMAVVLGEAPLGLTLDLLTKISLKLHSGLPKDRVPAIVEGVVDKLELAQMIHVYRFNSALVGRLGEAIGKSQLIDVNNLDVSLTQYLRRSAGSNDVQRWRLEATDVLMNGSVSQGSLADVTSALRLGELWPFCKSSFRHTHRGNLIAWLNAKEATEGPTWRRSSTDAYLERAIRLQHRMFQYPSEPINLKTALGEPEKDAPEQEHMWQALQGKSNCYLLDGKCDVGQWTHDVATVADVDIQAQSAASLAKALQVAQQPIEAWALLRARQITTDLFGVPLRRMNRVVPVAVEAMTVQADGRQLRIGNGDAARVRAAVQFRLHAQA